MNPARAATQDRRSRVLQPVGTLPAAPSLDALQALLRDAGDLGLSHRSVCTALHLWNTPAERLCQERLFALHDRLALSGRIRSEFRPLKQGPAPWGGEEFAIQESRYFWVSYPGSELFD